jgi:hypothetical protein
MIKLTLKFGGENQEVIVRGNELLFFDIASGMMTTIEGLRLNKSGVIKEFPDLKEDEDWKKKTIQRLKDKMKEYKTEMDRMNYVKEELIKQGYEPLFYQRSGFRPIKFKDGI